MKQIKKFLDSYFYPIIIAFIGFLSWVLPDSLLWLNNTLIVILLSLMVFVLIMFEDSKYGIPLFLSLVFTVNTQELNVDAVAGFSIFYLMFIMIVVGFVGHIIRFKPKFKFDLIALALLLIAVTYVIPLIYMGVSVESFAISISGFIYLAFYLFFKNTSKATVEDVLVYFFFASIQLMGEMLYPMVKEFFVLIKTETLSETFKIGLKTHWGIVDYGFGNINDLTIFLTILSSGIFYMILKKPNNYLYWLFALLSVISILMSGSRGGLISLVLILFIFFIILVTYGEHHQIFFASSLLVILALTVVVFQDVAIVFYNNFIQGGLDDLDAFSSGRISLYEQALKVFKEFPMFGSGWTYQYEVGNTNRIQIYHSTIFHTLAVTGLAGMAAVFGYTVISFRSLLKRLNLPVLIFGASWMIAMIHGLIDNTVHMVIFTTITVIMFAAIERKEVKHTSDKDKFLEAFF